MVGVAEDEAARGGDQRTERGLEACCGRGMANLGSGSIVVVVGPEETLTMKLMRRN